MEQEEQFKQRLESIAAVEALGGRGYAKKISRTHTSAEIIRDFDALESSGAVVFVAGRMKTARKMGKASFADLWDGDGRIQVYIKIDNLGESGYEMFKLLDLGDMVGVSGKVFKTRTGEITIIAETIQLLAKCLHPLPEKWHGLTDVEIRYRQRYVDLISNPEVKQVFETRIKIIRWIREFLQERGFIEVETPMMQALPGGASARPFKTHHNALDIDLYLRVAPELYLKRLIVGGFERVFEINRNFRNEGISTRHNPEFTMLELYQAYADFKDMMEITEAVISDAALAALGSTTLTYQGAEINLATPWKRIRWTEAFKEFAGEDIVPGMSRDELAAVCKRRGIDVDPDSNSGALMDKLFGELVEPCLVQPTFVYDYPTEISPLAMQRDDDPELTERFELFICNFEIANAFSELADPMEQMRRFEKQQALRDAGDAEAHSIDRDFVRALQFGMPPTGGLGIGIDRLIMILTDSASIRDVILFPLLRPAVAGAAATESDPSESPAE